MIGRIDTPVGPIAKVSASLQMSDHLGTIKARLGIGRMHYTVDPGLYAVGTPDSSSHVIVTANYKLTFDALRSELYGRNLWILVVDTDGINVWCAAGKGSFSVNEVARRIQYTGLDRIVIHRRVILPQLSAPGVAAHELKKLSGFNGVFGPIRAGDLPGFLDAGLEATPDMRTKKFPVWERIELIPIEFVSGFKLVALLSLFFLVITGFRGTGSFFENIMNDGLLVVTVLFGALLAGSVLTPILLPWLPVKAFSLKGVLASLFILAALCLVNLGHGVSMDQFLANIAPWCLMVPALAAFLAMNFTGCSTFTSLSGVKKEMKFAAPAEAAAFVLGAITWLTLPFIQ